MGAKPNQSLKISVVVQIGQLPWAREVGGEERREDPLGPMEGNQSEDMGGWGGGRRGAKVARAGLNICIFIALIQFCQLGILAHFFFLSLF